MSSYIISNREPIQFDKDRTRFALRLTPKGGRDAIEGWLPGSDGASHLKARVAVEIAGDGDALATALKALGDKA